MQGRAGRTPEIEAVKVVALYEAESGQIAHVHAVTICKGGRSVPDEEAVEAARAQAARLGHAAEQLRAQVSSNLEHAVTPHRIDPATGEFVPLPLPDLQRREREVLLRRHRQH